MISVKIDEHLAPVLAQIAENERRSQGAQIEYWIQTEAKKQKIKIVNHLKNK